MTEAPPATFVVAPEAADGDRERKRVQFVRMYRRFRGGHLKVWDYYNHVTASGTHVPYVVFSPGSLWDETNPWNSEGQRVVADRELLESPDIYFIAGLDWVRVDDTVGVERQTPVINFLQHVRHGHGDKEHSRYLERRAIRICCDPAVERSVRATGLVSGPLFTIQNGTDIRCIDDADTEHRDLDVLIVGLKKPEIGRRLYDSLASRRVRTKLIDSLVPRHELLADVRRAKVTLFLPNPDEGAYLPPMEGMALGTIVICPDHAGTSYVRDGENSFRPPYDDQHVLGAVDRALSMDATTRDALIEAGFQTVRTLNLDAEEESFLAIFRRVDELWNDAS